MTCEHASAPGGEIQKTWKSRTMYQRLARIFATAMILLVYFSRGLMFSVPGPTLLNLQRGSHTSIEGITWIFGARGIGLIIGGFLYGFIVKDRWRSVMFGLNFLIAGIAFGFSPWSNSLAEVVVAFIFNGFGMGYIEAACIVYIVQMWGAESATPYSFVVTGFIVGATVSPAIAVPFLRQHIRGISGSNSTLGTIGINTTGILHGTPSLSSRQDLEVLYFICMAIACISAIGLAFASFLVDRAGQSFDAQADFTKHDAIIPAGKTRVFVIFLIFLFVMVIIGVELNFYGMISAYIQIGLGETEEAGTLMVTYFWGLYSIFSSVGTVAFKFFTPSTILLCNLILMTASAIVMVAGPVTMTTLWVGTTLLSIGFGSTYAGCFIWGDFYLALSHNTSAVLVAGGYLGSIIVPAITGPFFEEDPFSLMIITLIFVVICGTIFVIVEGISFKYIKTHRPISLGRRKKPEHIRLK